MDSESIRKLKCFEKIQAALKEEHCKLEAGVRIIGTQLYSSEIFIIPLPASGEEIQVQAEEKLTVEEPNKEGETINE